MKIRTDFVTNSSTYNHVEIIIDNPVLLEILQRYNDMGLFADNDPFFGIGNHELSYYSSYNNGITHYIVDKGTKTPAFYYQLDEEEGYNGLSLIGMCPKTLDKVLTEIINRIDEGKEYMDPRLYSQLTEELHKKDDEIKSGYLNVDWRQRYSGDEEGEENFYYAPEIGERYEWIEPEDDYIDEDGEVESYENENR